MIKIYFRNKKIIIQENKKVERNISAEEIKNYIDEIQKQNSEIAFVFECKNEKEAYILFSSFFKVLRAAGGLVVNDKEEYLFIYRKNKWDLPKGKLDEGETTDKAAIREVQEECGIKDIKIIKELTTTYHIYIEEEQTVLKETVWYLMKTKEQKLIPQTEEDITKAEWKTSKDKNEIYNNTYENIKDVMNIFWN